MQAIQAVQISDFELMILTDTNITNQAYCRNRMGYDAVCSPMITTAAGNSQGGSVSFHLVPTTWLERISDAVPRAEHGDLIFCH